MPDPIPTNSPATENSTDWWINAIEFWHTIKRRFGIVLLIGFVFTAIAVGLASRFNRSYQSSALIRIKAPSKISIGSDDNQDESNSFPEPMELTRRVQAHLTSQIHLEKVIDHFHDSFTAQELQHREKSISWLAKYISVEHRGGNIYKIMARAHGKELCRDLTQYLAEQAVLMQRQTFAQRAIRMENFALGQMQKAGDDLRQVEEAMVDFLEAHPSLKVKSLDAHELNTLDDGDRLRTRRRVNAINPVAVGPGFKELLEQKKHLQRELRTLNESESGDTSSLSQALAEAKRQLAEMRSEGKTSSHPEVKQVQRRVIQLEMQIAGRAPGVRSASSDYEKKVRDELQRVERKILSASPPATVDSKLSEKLDVSQLEIEWSRFRRRHQELVEQYTKLQEIAVNATLAKNLRLYEASQTATILENPRLPEIPIGLNRRIIAIAGFLASIFLGLAAALLSSLLDKRLYSPEQIRKANNNLNILASLPSQKDSEVTTHQKSASNFSDEFDASMINWITAQTHSGYILASDGTWKTAEHNRQHEQQRAADKFEEFAEVSYDDGTRQPQATEKKKKWLDDVATELYQGPKQTSQALVPVSTHTLPKENFQFPPIKSQLLSAPPPKSPGLFVYVDPRGESAEQIRLVSTKIFEINAAAQTDSTINPKRILAVSSFEPGTGKTTVAANLALVAAESHKKVLLVDLHSGQGSLTKIFGLPLQNFGFFDQLHRKLAGGKDPWEMFFLAQTLALMPASVNNQSDIPLISSRALGHFLDDMAKIFELIVIDTPPLHSSSAAIALQRHINSFIIVARYGLSTSRGLSTVLSNITDERLLGLVFNNYRLKTDKNSR